MYTMHNVLPRLIILLVVAFLFQFTPNAQAAGEYPTRPIELLVPFTAGGTTDLRARALAPKMGEVLGQPVVVLNKTGAAGTLAATIVARAKPDGYTIGYATASPIISAPHMQKLEYDVLTDFTYVAGAAAVKLGCAIIVRGDAPYKTIGEFIDYAKTKPGEIKFAHAGIGSYPHSYLEMFAKVKNLKLVQVPFKGDQDALTALLGGHVSMASIAGFAPFVSHVQSGRLNILAVFMENRTVEFPQIPTVKEIGFPYDLRAGDILGIWGPKGLPPEVVKKLENAVKHAGESPEYKGNLERWGDEVRFRDSREFTKLIHDIYPQMGEMIKLLGFSKPSP